MKQALRPWIKSRFEMSRAGLIPIVVPALAIAALGAGCGGGGKQQVSAAELVQKGDQICRQEQSGFSQIQAHPPANASDAAENQDSATYGAAQAAVVQSAPERRRLARAVGFKACSANPGSA